MLAHFFVSDVVALNNYDLASLLAVRWIEHESMHLRHTDNEVFESCRTTLEHRLLNSLEDIRGDEISCREYPGSRVHLERATEARAQDRYEAWSKVTRPGAILYGYVVVKLMVEVHQLSCCAPIVSLLAAGLEKYFPGLEPKLIPIIMKVEQARSTWDCYYIVQEIIELLKEEDRSSQPQPPDDSDSDPDQGQKDESSDGSGDDSSDQADDKSEADKGDGNGEAGQEEEEEDSTSSAGGNSNDNEGDDDSESDQDDGDADNQSEEDDPSEGPGGDADGQEEGQGDDNPETNQNTEPEQSSEEDIADQGVSDAAADGEEDQSESDAAGKQENQDGNAKGEDAEGDDVSSEANSDSTDDSDDPGENADALGESGDSGDFESKEDGEEGSGNRSGKNSESEDSLGDQDDLGGDDNVDAAKGRSVAPVDEKDEETDSDSTQDDNNYHRALNASEGELPEDESEAIRRFLEDSGGSPELNSVDALGIEAAVQPFWLDPVQYNGPTNRLRAELQGYLQANARRGLLLKDSGRRVSTSHLSRVFVGNPNVFKARKRKKAIDTAIHILLDNSASMEAKVSKNETRMSIANKACAAAASALSVIPRINMAVTAFPGVLDQDEQGTVAPLLRHGESRVPNLALPPDGWWTPLGSAMWYGIKELVQQKEPRKILIAIIDGEAHQASSVHRAVALCPELGIETIGIGIQIENVRTYFSNSVVINDVEQLPATLLELLRDVLV